MEYLSLDGTETFSKITDIINSVFQKKNERGEDYEGFQRGGLHIKDGKSALFLHLAKRTENGGWFRFRKTDNYITIPEVDEKTFTQIQVNDNSEKQPENEHEEKAVFMLKKMPDGTDKYVFYGIFTAVRLDDVSVLFKRISTVLVCAEWRE